MSKFKIKLWYNNKKQEVIFPDFFISQGFKLCYTKKQFDYLKEECYDKDSIYFDYKAKKIYFHEWFEPELTGDCDYAWPAACDYSHKVYEMYQIC